MTAAVLHWIPAAEATDSLDADAVHVWRADLDRAQPDLTALSPEERERAAAFRFEPHRRQWAAARAILRQLLAGYMNRPARTIDFEPGRNGKPEMPAESIDFNLSHSGGTGVFAFAIENPVGVDVELAGRTRDAVGIAARVFGHDEAERLRAMPAAERQTEFLGGWVRHEAALKCRGDRLGAAVDPAELSIIDLEMGPGAAAAVAVERSVDTVALWEFDLNRPSGR